jgi:hypothetical protein
VVVALELEEAYCTCNCGEEVVTVPELEEADYACDRGEEVEHVHRGRRRGVRQRDTTVSGEVERFGEESIWAGKYI